MGKKVLKVEKLTTENGIIELEPGTQIIGGTFQQSTQWGAGVVNNDIHYSTGKVGLGTNDPRFTLDVNGTANVGALTTTSVSGDGSALTGIPNSAIPGLNNSQWTTNGDDVYIDNNSINVGIGTSTPGFTLDVNGTIKSTTVRATNIICETSLTVGGAAVALDTDMASNAARVDALYTATTGDIIVATDTNTLDKLGIGSSGQVLKVASGGTTLEWANESGGAGGGGDQWGEIGSDLYYETGRVSIGTNIFDANLHVEGTVVITSNIEVGTANLFINTSTSNVGIGTTTPGYALDVDGDVNCSGNFFKNGASFITSPWAVTNDDLKYTTGNVEVGTANLFVDIEHSNVGIGTSTPGYRLDVHGTANVGVLTTTSVSGDGSGLTALPATAVTGILDVLRIPNLPAIKITSGTFPAAQIPVLDASKITTGTLTVGRIPDLDAAKIVSGNLAIAQGGTGFTTGAFNPAVDTIKIGNGAGTTNQGANAIAIGHDAGTTSQSSNTVAVGSLAGNSSQGANTVAMGNLTGQTTQSSNAVAVGSLAGNSGQGVNAVAIGCDTGNLSQGANTVAIGYQAGKTNQHANSIILNASGAALDSTSASSFYVKPIRTAIEMSNVVTYNSTSGEVLNSNVTINASGHVTAVKFLGDGSQLQNLPSGGYNSAVDDIKIGNGAGSSNQGANTVAVGHDAGTTSQGTRAVAVGNQAGNLNQIDSAVAVGYQAGHQNQSKDAVAMGSLAGKSTQGTNSVAVGTYSGKTSQGANATAIGYAAGETNQHANSIILNASGAAFNSGGANRFYVKPIRAATVSSNVMTYDASNGEVLDCKGVTINASGHVTAVKFLGDGSGLTALNAVDKINIGNGAGTTTQGANTVAIGHDAGTTSQGASSVAVGYLAGNNNQGSDAVAVGFNAGKTTQSSYAVAVGRQAGLTNQGNGTVAMGFNAGQLNQSDYAVSIGTYAGLTNQGASAVAIGYNAGNSDQDDNSIILNATGSALDSGGASRFYVKPIRTAIEMSNVVTYNTTSGEVISSNVTINASGHVTAVKFLGDGSGLQNLPSGGFNSAVDTIKIGNGAGTANQVANAIAIGHDAGNSGQAGSAVAVGYLAGWSNQGTSAVSIGLGAGETSQSEYSVAIGAQAGQTTQGKQSVSIGNFAGNDDQSSNAVAMGFFSGYSNQSEYAVAMGYQAGKTTQGFNGIAIGRDAGNSGQGASTVAIGFNAGKTSQNNGAIAIGARAGETNQHANSIILNATSTLLDSGGASRFYVKPIRAATVAGRVMTYDATSGEVIDCTGVTVSSSGDVTATGDITAYSDRRLKTNVQRIENALDKVCALGGYTFTMNEKPSTGLIAQEVLGVLPEAVHGSEETQYSLAYGNMIGLLVEAVKELRALI